MAGCGCCGGKPEGEVFKPRRQRWCTDVICLVLFIACFGSVGFVSYALVSIKPSLLYGLIYPADSYGMYCGLPGTSTEKYPKVFFPNLDSDIVTHGYLITAQRYATFFERVTKLCAKDCPQGVSLSAPSVYGGASYPLDNSTGKGPVPEFVYAFASQEVASRCLPLTSVWAIESQDLCVEPKCTDAALATTLGGAPTCATIESRPTEATTWEICPSGTSAAACATRAAACSYHVTRTSSDTFLPEGEGDSSSTLTAQLATYVEAIVGAADAILTASGQVALFGIAASIVLGFTWCLLLFLFAGVIIWTSLLLCLAALMGISCFLAYRSGWFNDDITAQLLNVVDSASANLTALDSAAANLTLLGPTSGEMSDWYPVAAVFSIFLTVLLLLLLCLWRRNITRCIAVVKEASKVFKSLPVMMVWPLLALFFQLILLGCGVLALWWVLDDEVWTEVEARHDFKVSVEAQLGLALYVLFGFLWAIQLCKAISWTSMSSAVCYWFVMDSAKGGQCGKTGTGALRLLDATWTILFKHLGSMALGSAIIALCQLVRIVLELVDGSTKKAQDANLILMLALKCAKCAMWCLQKCIEFISYYAYIFVALEGRGFCLAAKGTFELLRNNGAQVAVNKVVGRLLWLLLCVSIPSLCALGCFFVLDTDAAFTARFSPIYPAAAAFVLALLIADGATTVYTCAIDSIYLCAFKDMAENDPPRFMSNTLRRGFGLAPAGADDEEQEPVVGKGGGRSSSKVAPEPLSRKLSKNLSAGFSAPPEPKAQQVDDTEVEDLQ